ncbi:MAG: response regulator, partial [Bacteroidota bacterium]
NKEELLNTVSSMFFVAPKLENLKSNNQTTKQSNIKGKPLVLVVEDNADNMTTVKALLGDDYIILEATDGIQGIELAKEHIPHLILMDIALPGMDGIEIFKVIRNENLLKHIPVIALTASAMLHNREEILSHGFDAYIPKPINDKLFFDTINEAIYGK